MKPISLIFISLLFSVNVFAKRAEFICDATYIKTDVAGVKVESEVKSRVVVKQGLFNPLKYEVEFDIMGMESEDLDLYEAQELNERELRNQVVQKLTNSDSDGLVAVNNEMLIYADSSFKLTLEAKHLAFWGSVVTTTVITGKNCQ